MDLCNKTVFYQHKYQLCSKLGGFKGAPERCFTQVGSGFTYKHKTRLERLANHKHSSLLQKSVNYGRNKFYSTGPCVN